jgi:hypothetical protein
LLVDDPTGFRAVLVPATVEIREAGRARGGRDHRTGF